MSLFSSSSIQVSHSSLSGYLIYLNYKIYGESIGLSNISEDACVVLAQDLEYRIREVIQVSLWQLPRGIKASCA